MSEHRASRDSMAASAIGPVAVATSPRCHECDRPVPRGAVWCGGCGALRGAPIPSTARPRPPIHDLAVTTATSAPPVGAASVLVTGPVRLGPPRSADPALRSGPPTGLLVDADAVRPATDRPVPPRVLAWATLTALAVAAFGIAAGEVPMAAAARAADTAPEAPATVLLRPASGRGRDPSIATLVDARTGAVALRGGPVIAARDGRTIHPGATGALSRDGRIAALEGDELVVRDAATKVLVARRGLGGTTDDGRVELLAWSGQGIVATVGDDLVAVDVDGSVRWRVVGAAEEAPRIAPGADWAVGRTGEGDSTTIVRDLRDGTVAWSLRLPATPAVAESARLVHVEGSPPVVVLVDGDEVEARSPADGDVLWRVRPVEPEDPAVRSELRLATADDVIAVLVARLTEGSSRVVMLDPLTGQVLTRVLGPVPASPLDRLDGTWAADARGTAVIGIDGVTTRAWRHDPNLLVVDDVVEVDVAGDALVLVRHHGRWAVELRDRGDHDLVATFDVVESPPS